MNHTPVSKLIVISLISLALVACDKKAEPARGGPTPTAPAVPVAAKAPDAQAAPANELHAHAGVEPGSHEDWCGEHAVPESMCTRCNASLVPAFKATGDWCPEHGLPESQCLRCNPELEIKRPPPAGESKR